MNNYPSLARAFAALSRAAARKRIYAVRTRQAGRIAESRLLAALATSEEVQARRLFNNLRGQIDLSENYLATIFDEELAEVLAEYEKQLEPAKAGGKKGLVQVLTQLRRAEMRQRSFYDQEGRKVTVASDEQYYLCPFCGYLATATVPHHCPVCGAAGESFREAG